MKKWKAFLGGMLLLIILFASCSSQHQNVYDPEKRVVLSANNGDARLEPDFDLNLLAAETIAAVKITSDGAANTRPIMVGFDEYPPEKRPKITYTAFEADVEEVWYGESTNQKITLHILGGLDTEVTKPQKGDRLVL